MTSPASWWMAMRMPPIDMIGAVINTRQVICTRYWICRTSLVVRVSNVGAPNRDGLVLGEGRDVMEHRRAQVASETHAGARTEVDRRDRAHHLHAGDAEHHHAEPDDGGRVALGDAVVDDRGVDRGQVQRRQRADHLQHHEHRDQPAVRPDVLAQQGQEHVVTVAHAARRSKCLLRRCVACLTPGAAATVHRVTSTRLCA